MYHRPSLSRAKPAIGRLFPNRAALFRFHTPLALDPGDAIQLVLSLCDEDLHLSSLHFNPRRSKRANANHGIDLAGARDHTPPALIVPDLADTEILEIERLIRGHGDGPISVLLKNVVELVAASHTW